MNTSVSASVHMLANETSGHVDKTRQQLNLE